MSNNEDLLTYLLSYLSLKHSCSNSICNYWLSSLFRASPCFLSDIIYIRSTVVRGTFNNNNNNNNNMFMQIRQYCITVSTLLCHKRAHSKEIRSVLCYSAIPFTRCLNRSVPSSAWDTWTTSPLAALREQSQRTSRQCWSRLGPEH